MARLTILQASQQGFGSTLTIHRHIKDGSLPVYEEGDAKLLEVDDLITVFGAPIAPVNGNGTSPADDEQMIAAVDQIDIYEYNRMKSELDQKNKKNMWLAADLAEVVREMKEKESKFEAERDRLLKVLEQAQALLLREGKRLGGGQKSANGSAAPADQSDQAAASVEIEQPAAQMDPMMVHQPADQSELDSPSADAARMPDLQYEEMPGSDGEATAEDSVLDTEGMQAATVSEAPSEYPADAPAIVVDEETRALKRGRSRLGVDPVNPLVSPDDGEEEEEEAPRKFGRIGTSTWIMLLTLVGCVIVFLKFWPQIMSSVEHVMQTLGYI